MEPINSPMDDIWQSVTSDPCPPDQGLESLLGESMGLPGLQLPIEPYRPLLRGPGATTEENPYLELACQPPYEEMERLWAEKTIDRAIEIQKAFPIAPLHEYMMEDALGPVAFRDLFCEQVVPDRYELPEYLGGFSNEPNIGAW
jgi:hypothetical protein